MEPQIIFVFIVSGGGVSVIIKWVCNRLSYLEKKVADNQADIAGINKTLEMNDRKFQEMRDKFTKLFEGLSDIKESMVRVETEIKGLKK